MTSEYNPNVRVEHFSVFSLLDVADKGLALLSIVSQTFL